MAWRNVKASNRSFIIEQNNRIIQEMSNNAAYLASVQRIEAAKSRMEEARIAMALEDNPVKKDRLTQLVGKYADEALVNPNYLFNRTFSNKPHLDSPIHHLGNSALHRFTV